VSVLENISASLLADAKQVAGRGNVISKAEAANLPGTLLPEAREAAGYRASVGARANAEEVVAIAMSQVERDLARINQTTGAGAAFLSADEVKRLQGVNPDTAARAAKAYELITGRSVALDGVPTSPGRGLPAAMRSALTEALATVDVDPAARVDIRNVRTVDGGRAFEVSSNNFNGSLFAREVDGTVFVASKPFDANTVRVAARAALADFDANWRPEMEANGNSAAEIADARASWQPIRIFLDGDSDPTGLTADFPIVFSIRNDTGSDHGVYVGVDPASGETMATNFN
jgi:hypothetical protein